VVTSAHTLPFVPGSTFTLSLGSFYGRYNTYAGYTASSGVTSRLLATHGDTFVAISSDVDTFPSLLNLVTPGELIQIGDQEFRVCSNQDETFVTENGRLTSSIIPLCTVEDPYVAKAFDAGFAGNTLQDIPLYQLDTYVGGAYDPNLGGNSVTILTGSGGFNPLSSELDVGDWVMVGHPLLGEQFRVQQNDGSGTLTLGTVADPAVDASLSISSLHFATYEVQTITLDGVSAGFRLQFRGANTFVSREGGDYGCLNSGLSADAVKTELQLLISIDQVEVSRSEVASTVTYTVTFVGDLVRGDVDPIVVLDVGSNGCDAGSTTSIDVDTIRHSVLPVYRLETTEPLAFDCSALEMSDAIEALGMVARADVSRVVEYNGYSWMVTFRGFSDDSTDGIAPLFINSVNIAAAIDGRATTYPVNEFLATNLTKGVNYFFEVAAHNMYGVGSKTKSTPSNKQPSDQVPTVPLDVRTFVVAPNIVNVQFAAPLSDGGRPVSSYRVQLDISEAFTATGVNHVDVSVLSSVTSTTYDVQKVTVVSDVGFNPYGTFVLNYLGQQTRELDYNISAAGVKAALEALSTIDRVDVSRDLFCSKEWVSITAEKSMDMSG